MSYRRGLLCAPVVACLLALAAPAVSAASGSRRRARSPTPRPVVWSNFREGKTAARHQDRPLLVYFTAARNTESGRLDRETWTDRRVRAYLAANLVTVRVDMQDMPGVAEKYGVGEPPAVMLLSPQGSPLVVIRGFHGPDSILRVATYAVSGAWEYADYATWLSRQPNR
jgi:thioredoxin-related protein